MSVADSKTVLDYSKRPLPPVPAAGTMTEPRIRLISQQTSLTPTPVTVNLLNDSATESTLASPTSKKQRSVGSWPKLGRLILYISLAIGYVIAAVLLAAFVYQQIDFQNQLSSMASTTKQPTRNNRANQQQQQQSLYQEPPPPATQPSVIINRLTTTTPEQPVDFGIQYRHGATGDWVNKLYESQDSEAAPLKPPEHLEPHVTFLKTSLPQIPKVDVPEDFAAAHPVEKLELEIPVTSTASFATVETVEAEADYEFPAVTPELGVKYDAAPTLAPFNVISPEATGTTTTMPLLKVLSLEDEQNSGSSSFSETTESSIETMQTVDRNLDDAPALRPMFESSGDLQPTLPSCNSTFKMEQKVAENICQSDECVLAASNIIRLLNRQVNPCQDFYEYTCGNFGEVGNGGELSQNALNRFPNQIEQTYKFLVEKTLEKSSLKANSQMASGVSLSSKYQDEYLNKIRGFYASCMHQQSFTKYLTELKKFLFGVGSIAARSTDLTRIVGELVLRDVFPLFGISVHRPPLGDGRQDVDGRLALTAPTRHLHPFALQPSASSSSTFIKIESVVDLLADELSSAFGIDKSSIAAIDRDMEASRLRNLYASTFIQQNRDCEKTLTVASMLQHLGNFSHLFDWQGVVQFLSEQQLETNDGSSNRRIDTICVSNEFRRYMLSMEPVFANITRMELLLYSTFKAGQHLINYWTVFEEHGNSFSKRAECYKLVHDNFREFVAEIVRNSLAKPELIERVENITSIIRRIAPNFSTINLSEQVLKEIEQVRSHLPEIRNLDELIELHRKIPEMTGRSFLPNLLSSFKFKNQRELSKVGPGRINLVKELDLILSLKAQAAFVPPLRQIRLYPLLLGLISPELGYSGMQLPSSFLYGTLGFALAHEFSHVLQFYQEQSVKRDQRLLQTFRAREERRKDCLNERNAQVLRQRLGNSSRMGWEDQEFVSDASDGYLNELWADALGLKLAFHAQREALLENNEADVKLPGLGDLTPSQLFFVSFSQVFCSKAAPHSVAASLKRSLRSSFKNEQKQRRSNFFSNFAQFSQDALSHPPNYVRAALPLWLFREEFDRTFNCPARKEEPFDDCI